MNKYILLTALLLALLLQGCLPSAPPSTQPTDPTAPRQTQPTTTAPPVTTSPPTTTAPPTTTPPTVPPTQPPTTAPTNPTISIGTVDPDVYAELTAKFSEPTSWFNMALTCEYASPEELDLRMLFYNGFVEESSKPTALEYTLLKEKLTYKDHLDYMDLQRRPVSKMDAVLTECFGLLTADFPKNSMIYLEETDCYYTLQTGANYALISEFTGAEMLDNGNIRIFYTQSRKNYAVTLRPIENRYVIWSNLPV